MCSQGTLWPPWLCDRHCSCSWGRRGGALLTGSAGVVFIFTSGFRVPLKLPLVGERTASLIAGGLPRALRHGRTSHKTLPSGQDSPSPKRDTAAQKDGTSCSRTFTGCALTPVHLVFALKPDACALTMKKKVLTPGISFADKHNKELKGCWEAFAGHSWVTGTGLPSHAPRSQYLPIQEGHLGPSFSLLVLCT